MDTPNTPKQTQDLASLAMSLVGVAHVAYIKPVQQDVGTGFAVFAADGTQLAVFPSYEAAFFTARQHNLEPVSIH